MIQYFKVEEPFQVVRCLYLGAWGLELRLKLALDRGPQAPHWMDEPVYTAQEVEQQARFRDVLGWLIPGALIAGAVFCGWWWGLQ